MPSPHSPGVRVTAAAAALAFVVVAGPFERLLARFQAPQPASVPGGRVILRAGPDGPHTMVASPWASAIRAGKAQRAATFVVTYSGFTAQAQAAFQAAVDIWSAQLTASVPIRVNATWTDLCTPNSLPPGCGILGSAGPWTFYRDFAGAPQAGTWYPIPTANQLAGSDLDPANPDIVANFNSTWSSWYYGTDGSTPAGQIDFESVVLHELGHGLGFLGFASYSGGTGTVGTSGYPSIWERSVVNGSAAPILSFTSPSAALGTQLVGNNLFWNGANGVAANSGTRPKLYAPASWQSGSSYSHLDETTYGRGDPNSLMTPQIGTAEAIHDAGAIGRGILKDNGWTVASTPPPTFTDDPLTTGSTGVKAVHVTELRQAVDTLRARYSLGAYSWTDGTLTAGSTSVKAIHVSELRTALAAVYTAASRALPSYTDATLTATSTAVKAAHITELRNAVLAIW